jgi:transcriptional regulator with XRE-family HTH domain
MDEQIISRNLKTLRTRKKLTLEELARRTGLTKGYLSKVERSKKAPPYSTLTRIAGALDVSVTAILSHTVAPPEDVRMFVSRACDRTIIEETPQFAGYDYEVLAGGKPGKNMEPFIIHAPFEIHKMYSHEGEECIYGDQTLILDPGDNVYFDSNIPHAGRSLGDKKARLLVIIYFYKRNQV